LLVTLRRRTYPQNNMDNFIFKKDTHQYFLNGVELPSVSKIISPLADFSNVSPELLERAGLWGQAVNDTCRMCYQGTLNEKSLDPLLTNPLEQFNEWRQKEGIHIVNFEKPQYNKRLGYAGTPDIELPYKITDIKTRPVKKVIDLLQLCGYAKLVYPNLTMRQIFKEVELGVLELPVKGKYQYTKLSDAQGMSMFRFLLDDYYYRQEKERRLKLWQERK